MMDIYIYYGVARTELQVALQHVSRLQRRIQRDYGIAGRLQRRSPGDGPTQTWMEMYTAVPAGFADVIERAADEEGMTTLVQSARHVECFEDVPLCA